MADHEWMEHGSCSDMSAGQWLGAGLEALEALGRDAPLGEPLLRAAASRSPPVVGLGSLAAAFASSSAWLAGVPAEQQSVFACAGTSNGAGGQRRLTAVYLLGTISRGAERWQQYGRCWQARAVPDAAAAVSGQQLQHSCAGAAARRECDGEIRHRRAGGSNLH